MTDNVTPFPGRRPSIARLACTRCGAETVARCNCGVEYRPAAERATDAIAASPERSDRAIAAESGVSKDTVRRARSTGADAPVGERRVGRDGKARRLPTPKRETFDQEAIREIQAVLSGEAPEEVTLPEAYLELIGEYEKLADRFRKLHADEPLTVAQCGKFAEWWRCVLRTRLDDICYEIGQKRFDDEEPMS